MKKIPMELEALTVTTRQHLDDIINYYIDKASADDISRAIDVAILTYLKHRFMEILDRLDGLEAE